MAVRVCTLEEKGLLRKVRCCVEIWVGDLVLDASDVAVAGLRVHVVVDNWAANAEVARRVFMAVDCPRIEHSLFSD